MSEYETLRRESYLREANEQLTEAVDNAVRRTLVDQGLGVRYASGITNAIIAALTASDPLSLEEVKDAINRDGGFLRVNDSALIDGRFVPPGTVISALLWAQREEIQVADKSQAGGNRA